VKSNPKMEQKLSEACRAGLIVYRTENNQYLKVSYKGTGNLISDKWNIKIYTSGSVVCNDFQTLDDILNGSIKKPDTSKILLQADDSGWGFPLLGIMIGITDGREVKVDTVDVSFFREGTFQTKAYLKEYAKKGVALIEGHFGATPQTHRIEICTGYVNKNLKSALRNKGYDVRVVEVKGLLQDKLEAMFKEYVKQELRVDLAFDPKEFDDKSQIGYHYNRAVEWGRKNAPHLLKTGWKSI